MFAILVRAINEGGNCSTVGCDGDLRQHCPSELALKENDRVIACKSVHVVRYPDFF